MLPQPFRRALLLAWLFALAPLTWAATPNPADIDKLFAAWDKPDSPGLALAVVKDGRIVHSRGYGQASLEYGIPIKPGTIFHAASLSKQFTGFAIQLLAQEGKLSLDDPVKKYVPQLQVEGPPITIRHLLHHTSGLRDQWDLLTLAGLRLEDFITENDILGLVFQQKQLNFQPGEDHLYSNTGYTLLGQVVRRVSGQSLAAFAQERIFTPLGMKSTHFQENYGTVVKNRAYSYARGRDGNWRYLALSYSNTGATSVFTTVEDLALWSANFDQPRAGNAQTVQASLVTGKTNDGRDTSYASGNFVAATAACLRLRTRDRTPAIAPISSAAAAEAGGDDSRKRGGSGCGATGAARRGPVPRGRTRRTAAPNVSRRSRGAGERPHRFRRRLRGDARPRGELLRAAGQVIPGHGRATDAAVSLRRESVLREDRQHDRGLHRQPRQWAVPGRGVEGRWGRVGGQAPGARNAFAGGGDGLRGRLLQPRAAHPVHAGDSGRQVAVALSTWRDGVEGDQSGYLDRWIPVGNHHGEAGRGGHMRDPGGDDGAGEEPAVPADEVRPQLQSRSSHRSNWSAPSPNEKNRLSRFFAGSDWR
jgi:CubicO group peptidase (beta-lactamase class C family)